MIQSILKFDVDLNHPIQQRVLNTLLFLQNKQAHRIDVTLTQNGTPVALDGATVSAYMIRANGDTVVIDGSSSGSTASITLPETCYAVTGRVSLVMQVADKDSVTTILCLHGTVITTNTDTIVDPSNVVPSLSELLAQVATIRAATEAANNATQAANDAAASATQQTQAALDNLQSKLSQGAFDGKDFKIIGYYPSLSALQSAVPDPARGDAYGIGSAAPYDVYIWDGMHHQWVNNGKLQGAKGDPGAKGEPGAPGQPGADGLTTSVNGVQQVDGAITLKAENILTNSDKSIEAVLNEMLTVQDLYSKVIQDTMPQVLTLSRAGKLVTLAMKTEQRVWSSGNLVITLPEEARPTGQIDVPVVLGASGQGVFRIATDGKCTVATISDTSNKKSMFVAVSYIAAN